MPEVVFFVGLATEFEKDFGDRPTAYVHRPVRLAELVLGF